MPSRSFSFRAVFAYFRLSFISEENYFATEKHINIFRYKGYNYHIDIFRCEVLMDKQYLEIAKVFKAFCDETRLMVLGLLQSGEKCACDLLEQVEVGQSTLSHHMKILVESKVVSIRKDGKWTYYSIDEQGSQKAMALLTDLTTVDKDLAQIQKMCR